MAKKNDYLTNLPKVTAYDTRTQEAKKELFYFFVNWSQKHELTPSQEMFLLSDLLSYISARCMSVENRQK